MKMRNEMITGDYSLDPKGVLNMKVKDHGKEFRDVGTRALTMCAMWES